MIIGDIGIYVHNLLLTFNYLDLDLDIIDILLDIFKTFTRNFILPISFLGIIHIYTGFIHWIYIVLFE